jgi:hypothetical protein
MKRSEMQVDDQRLAHLCETIKVWWEEHRFDTAGDYGEWNVYDSEPSFVEEAKAVVGDWESQS